MVSMEEHVPSHFPCFEEAFSLDDIQELLSFVQEDFPVQSTSGSETNRKRKRMISNRESARRSRWRKKRQLEDLTNEANQLKAQNRELKNRLSSVSFEYFMVQSDSSRLFTESIELKQKLAGLYQILSAMQL
ncbi:hypothetical protein Leryth_015199 [Lithospermum erythrorhizon]|uniref:BZIP domain-containing protein n=1 Tax=Lithospermum erythrorhizon TaxID=34254 RepID=A0AAV3QQM8_LITER|nr:hypothetical protein Leryth_015199 [Lithospermum erythrorhizon]